MTIEQYDRLMSKQKGKCAICKCEFSETDRALIPCVDHDHQTGAVRGLLCFNCNTVLGKVKDSPQILKRAISYLERF